MQIMNSKRNKLFWLEINYLLAYSSSSPLGHQALISPVHCIWSLAASWAFPQDSFTFPAKVSQFCALAYLALPGFLLPGGSHFKVTLGITGLFLFSTHGLARCLCRSSLVMLQPSGFLYRWWLFGQKKEKSMVKECMSCLSHQDHLYLDLLDVKTE